MKILSLEEFENLIMNPVMDILNEAVPPKPLSAPKPLNGGAPKPLNGGPKPLNGGAPKPLGGGPKPLSTTVSVQGNAPASMAPPTLPDTDDAPKKFNGGPTQNGYRVGIVDAKYEGFYESTDPNETDKEVFKIWLNFIHDVHAQRWVALLNHQFGDIVSAYKVLKSKADKTPMFSYTIKIVVRPGKMNDFLNAIPQIVDSLYNMPVVNNKMTKLSVKYDDTFKNDLITLISDFATKVASSEDIEQANIRIADTWYDLLSDLKNPETLQKLGGISGFISSSLGQGQGGEINGNNVKGDNGKSAGHQLSLRNKMEVFAQDSAATFVCEASTWRNIFNHEVIDPSKFILITKPSKKKGITQNDKDAAARKAGYMGGYDDFKTSKKKGEVSNGENHAVEMQKNLHAVGSTFFSIIKVYDIANTRVIAGMESKFLPGPNQERNLQNNLLGIPNAAAKSIFPDVTNTDDQQDDNQTPALSNEHVDMIKDSLIAIYRHLTGTGGPNETGNAEKDIVNYAYAYADFLLKTTFNISKPETQEAFKQGFTAAVAYGLGVKDTQAADYLYKALNNRGKDSTIRQLIVQWHREYVDLMVDIKKDVDKKLKAYGPKKKVVEGIEEAGTAQDGIKIMSLDQFERMFGVDGEVYEELEENNTTENIQESFFRLLDKLERL